MAKSYSVKDPRNLSILTDFYELTMGNGYFENGYTSISNFNAALNNVSYPALGGEEVYSSLLPHTLGDTVASIDYKNGIGSLPKSDVLTFKLNDGSVITVRPSGTEPKMKIYTEVFGSDAAEARELTARLSRDFDRFIKGFNT